MLGQITQSLRMVFVAPVRLYWVQYAALALAAGSALMGASSSKKAAKEAKRAAEREAAIQQEQSRIQIESIAASRDEARHKAKNDIHDTTIAFMQQRASVVAGAGEAGVAGGSIIRTLVDRTRNQQEVSGRALYALEVFNEQSGRDIAGAKVGLAAASQPYKGVSSSSLNLAAGLNFASSALSIGTNADGKWIGYNN